MDNFIDLVIQNKLILKYLLYYKENLEYLDGRVLQNKKWQDVVDVLDDFSNIYKIYFFLIIFFVTIG